MLFGKYWHRYKVSLILFVSMWVFILLLLFVLGTHLALVRVFSWLCTQGLQLVGLRASYGMRDQTWVRPLQGRHSTIFDLSCSFVSWFQQYWESNPGPHTCKARALSLSYIISPSYHVLSSPFIQHILHWLWNFFLPVYFKVKV